MLDHLRPQYAKAFRCIGSDCEDTCCHGLDVVIDQAGYERLRSLPDLQEQVQQHFVILPSPGEKRYARIQLDSSYTCPFLSTERLCSVQQKHGDYYLADICTSYPRLRQRIDGMPETSLLLSCPEAARLVLLNPNLLPDVPADSARYQRFLEMALTPVRANGSPHQFLWDIREFSLLLIRDRNYPLWQRLFILGMFCRRLNEVTQASRLELVPKLFADYARIIREGMLRPAMEGMPSQPARQLGIVLEIVNRQLGITDISHTRFRECVQSFLEGIHFDQTAAMDSFLPYYRDAYIRRYAPFFQLRPFILENYLANYIFRTRFPYGTDPQGQTRDQLTEYMAMIIFYAVIKALLMGMAAHLESGFEECRVVQLIQTFTKAVEQCPKFEINKYMRLANAEGIATLLKND